MHTTNESIQGNLINKGSEYWCSFFVMPGIGPALLGMQDCKRLQLMSINCQTVSSGQKGRKGNGQTKQGKSKINKDFKISPHIKHKSIMETD